MLKAIDIYVCDDEKAFIEEVTEKIISLAKGKVDCNVTSFLTGESLLKQCMQKKPNVVILDIDMPGMSGFQVAKSIQEVNKDVMIIFYTSHDDKVYQVFEYKPFWFVRKSCPEEFDKLFPKLLQQIEINEIIKNNLYNFHGDYESIEIDLNTVMYVESNKNHVVFIDKYKKPISVRCRMSTAEKQLSKYHFVRIQLGYLVNCRYISKVASTGVTLMNGKKLGIGRSKVEYVKDAFQKYVIGSML